MLIDVAGDTPLTSLQGGDTRPISEWTTTFQLALVVLDPYTHESSWLLETAGRILRHFAEADCRTAFVVTADVDDTRHFLGPWAEEMMVFTDPDRVATAAFELEQLPAFVHVDQATQVLGKAEGWQAAEWREVAIELARVLSWRRPNIPEQGDPTAFAGSPAAG